jgi:hypothetical protein
LSIEDRKYKGFIVFQGMRRMAGVLKLASHKAYLSRHQELKQGGMRYLIQNDKNMIPCNSNTILSILAGLH